MNPWAARELAIVEPEVAPVRRRFEQLVGEVLAIFEAALDNHIDIGLEKRKLRACQRQSDAGLATRLDRDIDPDPAARWKPLPGHGLDIVARDFDPRVALLTDVVFGHFVPIDGVKDAIDRRGLFAWARFVQAERGESGS